MIITILLVAAVIAVLLYYDNKAFKTEMRRMRHIADVNKALSQTGAPHNRKKHLR